VENKMKKLAISVLAIAVTCCGVHGMEMCETNEIKSSKLGNYTELFPREFWSNTEMVSKCIAEVKEDIGKEITEDHIEGNPINYHILFKGYTWAWICKNFQYNEMYDKGRFFDSVCYQFPDVEMPFLDVIKELGLEERYWTREGWPIRRIRSHRKYTTSVPHVIPGS
jgi:predicted transcriptional regulator